MSALAHTGELTAPAIRRTPLSRRTALRYAEPGRQSLEDRIAGIWEELRSAGHAGCPVCGGELIAGDGCRGCGSHLD